MPLAPIDRLALLTASQAAALQARFAEVRYDESAIGRGESIASGQFDALRLPLVHDALHLDDAPASDLALLFAYYAGVTRERLDRALTPALAALALDLGLVTHGDDGLVRSPFLLMPFVGMWLLSDPLSDDGDAVMGPGPTTNQLARLVPWRCPPSVLDVGCGAGTLALLAASRGATHAVGTDINARAIPVARFNAALNGLSAEFVAGDLFAPVGDRRFDLVLSQPPFVPKAPESRDAVFLYGGAFGDELALSLLAQAPARLNPGGRALVLLDTPVRPDAPLHARVRSALGDAPVDLALFTTAGMSPDMVSIGYSARSLVDLDAYGVALRQHRAHLRSLGVTEFCHAVVMLLSPGGRFTITLPVRSLDALDGDSLERWSDAIDLASGDDGALRAAALRPAAGLVFVEERATPDRSVEPRWWVRAERGVATSRELSDASWALLECVATRDTVDEAVEAYAELCAATPDEVRPQVLGFVREQLAKGLLVRRPAE